MFNLIARYLIKKAMRTPYFHLLRADGSAYMERYWLVPYTFADKDGCYRANWRKQPIVWLFQKFDIAIRVHHIMQADTDRHMHDHPWDFASLVLDGFYLEARPATFAPCFNLSGEEIYRTVARMRGQWAFRKATDRHNVIQVSPNGVWTLFITFRKKQSWGFYTRKGKIYYQDYEAHGEDAKPMAIYCAEPDRYVEVPK